MKERVLIVEDDKMLLEFLVENLSMNGYEVEAFTQPLDAIDFLEGNKVPLVLTDVKMDDMTGDEVLAHIKEHYPETGVIMMTSFGNITHAVRALQKGAFDYITKPFKAKEITFRVNRFFESDKIDFNKEQKIKSLVGTTNKADQQPSPQENDEDLIQQPDEKRFIGEDEQVKKLMEILPQIAKSTAPVMIQGESGTGKEVFANLIHQNSNRSDQPYVKINCANLPKELVESTLFGHVKGAFTGAISDKKGAFEEANGGTILLDEITEIDINIQAKLLRVLQENEFNRVGSQESIQCDVRVLATSNRNIAEAIADNQFREDLYYRLNVFPISIPPLRERRDDIPLLVNFFVDRYTEQYGLEPKEVSDELMEHLVSKKWKGNVRELENKIHRGVILSTNNDTITLDHIERNLFSKVDLEVSKEVLSDLPLISIEDMELQLIKKALEHTQGNQKEAAKILGITDRTIRNKIKKASENEEIDE
ncbi:sigma-54-dependent Fis family transcriptional regulator [Aliifodinibius salipaludis]|uniref:Sigma-54-dependent Fis family transcriptional regulator n=1 Tax=Fodinibius salipaludis TaxID=2032627 RepID=A0A2A2GC75_9BACT|nr:sigma-54 dependent transcriptional regulator [Aliifodinibius salipaludis]PAU94594.1 sigma-54-dependent Fis family transcriptional regulator [Aliifodinibius salipaludis]